MRPLRRAAERAAPAEAATPAASGNATSAGMRARADPALRWRPSTSRFRPARRRRRTARSVAGIAGTYAPPALYATQPNATDGASALAVLPLPRALATARAPRLDLARSAATRRLFVPCVRTNSVHRATGAQARREIDRAAR